MNRWAATWSRKLADNPLLKSSLALGILTALTKVLGYGEKIVLAYKFGTGDVADVYQVVSTIIMSVFLFYREITEPGFLNTFMRMLPGQGETSPWAVFNKVFRYIFYSVTILTVLVFIFPGYAIRICAPGLVGEKMAMATTVVKWSFPACIFLTLSVLTNISLNGLKIFAIPAMGEVVNKCVILVVLVLLYDRMGIYAIPFGFIVGAGLKLLVHFKALYRKYSYSGERVPSTVNKQLWALSWPIIIGMVFSQASTLIDLGFASHLREGAIAALSYSKKVVELPILIFPYILSVTVFPYFSALALSNQDNELRQLFGRSLMWIIVVILPLSAFFTIYNYEIIHVIFKRGAFNDYSTLLTARPLMIYALGMPFFAIETVLVIYYFSLGSTRVPIAVGIICVIENILLTLYFIRTYDYLGIAMAYSISKATKVVILFLLLKGRVTVFNKFLLKIIPVLLLTVITIAMIKYFVSPHVQPLVVLILAGMAGSIVYATFIILFGITKSGRTIPDTI